MRRAAHAITLFGLSCVAVVPTALGAAPAPSDAALLSAQPSRKTALDELRRFNAAAQRYKTEAGVYKAWQYGLAPVTKSIPLFDPVALAEGMKEANLQVAETLEARGTRAIEALARDYYVSNGRRVPRSVDLERNDKVAAYVRTALFAGDLSTNQRLALGQLLDGVRDKRLNLRIEGEFEGLRTEFLATQEEVENLAAGLEQLGGAVERIADAQAETNATLTKVSADVAGNRARLEFLEDFAFGRMSPAEQLEALDGGYYPPGLDDEDRALLRSRVVVQRNLQYAGQAFATLGQVAAAFDLDPGLQRGFAAGSALVQIASSVATSNPLGVVSGIIGLVGVFGKPKPSPFVAVFESLQRIERSLSQLKRMTAIVIDLQQKTLEALVALSDQIEESRKDLADRIDRNYRLLVFGTLTALRAIEDSWRPCADFGLAAYARAREGEWPTVEALRPPGVRFVFGAGDHGVYFLEEAKLAACARPDAPFFAALALGGPGGTANAAHPAFSELADIERHPDGATRRLEVLMDAMPRLMAFVRTLEAVDGAGRPTEGGAWRRLDLPASAWDAAIVDADAASVRRIEEVRSFVPRGRAAIVVSTSDDCAADVRTSTAGPVRVRSVCARSLGQTMLSPGRVLHASEAVLGLVPYLRLWTGDRFVGFDERSLREPTTRFTTAQEISTAAYRLTNRALAQQAVLSGAPAAQRLWRGWFDGDDDAKASVVEHVKSVAAIEAKYPYMMPFGRRFRANIAKVVAARLLVREAGIEGIPLDETFNRYRYAHVVGAADLVADALGIAGREDVTVVRAEGDGIAFHLDVYDDDAKRVVRLDLPPSADRYLLLERAPLLRELLEANAALFDAMEQTHAAWVAPPDRDSPKVPPTTTVPPTVHPKRCACAAASSPRGGSPRLWILLGVAWALRRRQSRGRHCLDSSA